jgi:hypothetical protein
MVCDGVSEPAGAGWVWRRRVVQSNGQRPPQRQHRGALASWCPARHQVGPGSMMMLPVEERVERPIVAAPIAYAAPVAIGCRCSAPPVNYRTGQLLI